MLHNDYTPEYRAGICIQILRGEREIDEIASENELSPVILKNWKDEFIRNAGKVFGETSTEREIQRKMTELEQEIDLMIKTIARLTMERDYLQDCFRRNSQTDNAWNRGDRNNFLNI